jgi:signal transduction histidine kinase
MKQINVKKYILYFIGLWTLAITFAIYRSILVSNQQFEENLKIEAEISYNKDILYRKWVSMQGGVYVHISKNTPPNPYLTFIDNRDILTTKGDSLTLVNPAYMTRQVNELGKDEYGAVGHLTSLNPINPINTSNKLEKQALLKFEKGDTLFVANDTINGEVFFTYSRPFKTEQSCLKCHAHQGYKVGDIRGALFTYVPIKGFLTLKKENVKSSTIIFLSVWFVGALAILFVMAILQKQVKARKIADETIVQRNTELRQLNIDKDRFISILGHDLKSPFNGLLGFSELLTKNIRKYDIDKIENFANQINTTAQSTFKLLEDILMWARAQQDSIVFQPQTLNLSTTCENILELLKPSAYAKGISMSFTNSDPINVYADANMLSTVLRNLVSNAIKFTNSDGSININAEQNSENVTISVSDNGVGIPPENLEKLFDISEVLTTKGTEKETGTGLGLLLCKEFVEKHGGKIWVESEEGKGSDFKFTLPCYFES